MAKRAKKKNIKADEIRRYVADHPKAGPTEVANALTEKTGEKFTPQHVSSTLNTDKKKSGKTRKTARKARAKQPDGQRNDSKPLSMSDNTVLRDTRAAYSAAVELLSLVDQETAHEIIKELAKLKDS